MQTVERIACSIHGALLPGAAAWETLGAAEQTVYLDAARRALQALRMPSDAMLAEGNRRDLPADAANIWERMIYRALSE